MKFKPLSVPDVILLEPQVYTDERGFFFESYREDLFRKEGIVNVTFVQDNHSRSCRGVLRGLHYQVEPMAQAKLIRVIRGEIFDAVVDIRPASKTFGQHVTQVLSAENKLSLFIPVGFAHGFCVLEDGTEVLYKVSEFYSPGHERGIRWNDSTLGIAWPKLEIPYLLSTKDRNYPSFSEVFGNFIRKKS